MNLNTEQLIASITQATGKAPIVLRMDGYEGTSQKYIEKMTKENEEKKKLDRIYKEKGLEGKSREYIDKKYSHADETGITYYGKRTCSGCLKKFDYNLKQCSICMLSRYCSVSCQERRWPNHKKLCRAE